MSKLADLLIEMADDTVLQHKYTKDPDGVMNDYGLNDAEKAALRSENTETIQKAAGGHQPKLILFKLILAHPDNR